MSRVLVVDDRDENLEYLRALLTAHGYAVETARHGAEALESARAVLPDIVVSDLLMPVMDGYTLLRFWKADAALRQVPFVVYSATYVEPEDQQLAMSLGADAFVLKPAEATDFLARLREVQSRPAAASELPGPSEDEKVLLRLYSETLIRKLEEKSRQLEESNRILQLDIVERRKAEDALREREAELRQLTEAMPQIVWVARPDGWPAHFNQRWMEYTGLTLEESLARGWLPVFHPDDRPQAALRWAEATESGKPFEIEGRLRQHDGAYRWMLGRALPLRDPAGTILRWMGTCTDIHDLKEAKEALAESQRQQRFVLEAVGEGIHGLDPQGRIAFQNPAAYAMFGWELSELIGRDAHATVHHHTASGEAYPVDACPIHQTLRDGTVRRVDGDVFFRRDGSSFPVEYVASPVRDESGAITGAVVSFRDVAAQRLARKRLEETAALLRIAGRAARLGGWTLELPERKLTWSDENCLIHDRPPGYSPSFQEDLDCYAAEDRAQVLRYLEACERDGTPFEFELPITTHTGRPLWVLSVGEAVRNDEGQIVRLQGALQDISERKRADEALRQSENELRALAESMPQMVWITDASGLNFYLNQRWVEYTGLTLEESYGEGYTEAFHPDDRQRVAMEWERARAARTDYSIECRIRRGDGNYRWMLVRGLPFPDDRGRIVKWIGTCTDIHDLKEANTMLREQASLLDMAQDAIIVRDLDHRILYWNRSAERLYGWTAEEVRGSSVDELLYTDAQAFRNATEIVKEKGEWVGEIDQCTKSGRTLTVEGHWSLVRDDQGNPRSVLAINTNITEKKLLEAQFLRAQRMESIGTLAGGIAHDFNNLLAPIIMGAGYLQRMESREKVLAVIKNIERSANRGKELVKQVLSFAKGIEGQRITLQLSHIVREVESIIASTFPKNLTFERRIASQLWLVDGDPSQLNQVLLNLCVNARDAMPQGGRLLVTAQNAEVDAQYAAMNREAAPGRYVLLEVTDEGSGMAQEVLDRAFEPFFTTKTHGQGTGLGLSTVIGIVRSHGGFLNVSSEIGKGTTFKVYLPAKIETSESGQEAAVSEALPRGEGELILIVDDEASILSVTKQTLESFGYRAMVAEDGAQAIVLFADHRDEIAVVLTDMMMPVMNGPALIAALRRIDPEVKIIAASGLSTEASGLASGSSGVRHFLSKPYSADHLLILLKTVLSEGE